MKTSTKTNQLEMLALFFSEDLDSLEALNEKAESSIFNIMSDDMPLFICSLLEDALKDHYRPNHGLIYQAMYFLCLMSDHKDEEDARDHKDMIYQAGLEKLKRLAGKRLDRMTSSTDLENLILEIETEANK